MALTPTPRLIPFFALALGFVVLLSLAWIWLGEAYIGLLLRTVSPFLPASVDLEQHGHEILFFGYLAPGEESAVDAGIRGMGMSYGLILATAMLLAMPGVRPGVRLTLIAVAILTAFLGYAVGLYMLVQRMDSIVRYVAVSKDFANLARSLTYVWLFIPSLVWLPLLFHRRWLLRRS